MLTQMSVKVCKEYINILGFYCYIAKPGCKIREMLLYVHASTHTNNHSQNI